MVPAVNTKIDEKKTGGGILRYNPDRKNINLIQNESKFRNALLCDNKEYHQDLLLYWVQFSKLENHPTYFL